MSDRDKKLAKLQVEKAAREMEISEKGGKVHVSNGDPFIEALQLKIDELKSVLSTDVNVNVDNLIDQLKQVQSIAPLVEDLKKAIADIVIPDMPEVVKISGLQELANIVSNHVIELKKIPSIQLPEANIKVDIEQVGREGILEITNRLDSLIEAIREKVVPNQSPNDFIPVRRVQKVGARLVFDDGYWGGGSSGGGGGSLLFTGQSSGVAESTSTIYDGDTALTPKFATISTGVNGDNTIVSAVSGKKIRILSYMFISSGSVTATWQSNATNISGPMPLIASTGVSAGYNPKGHFETLAGEDLQINQNSTAILGGHLIYVEI